MTFPARPIAAKPFAEPAAALLAVLLGLAILLGLGTPAAAQGFGWFGNLFGGFPRPNQGAPSYPGYGNDGYAPRQPSEQYYARPRRRIVRRPAEPVQREVAKVPLKNASAFVAVFGDSLGQMLGQGLDEALADRPDVAVAQKARASTGLVASEGYDWPRAIAELLGRAGKAGAGKAAEAKSSGGRIADGRTVEKAAGTSGPSAPSTPATTPSAPAARETIDVAVMMIGINDHQPLTVDGHVLQPGTAEWTAAYAKRVTAIDEAFHARGIPLIWVGVPITKDDAFADAMAGLNDVYREAAAKTGATYVDTWEAFSDDNGNFAAYGPDVNGQTVRLRAADGIHFTKAGARKLAHFVEAQVRRALEGKTQQPLLPTESAEGKGSDSKGGEGAGRQLVAARPDVGPIRNLNEAPSAADGALAAARLPSDNTAEAAGGKGEAGQPDPVRLDQAHSDQARSALAAGDAAPPGRADNARWSGDAAGVP